MLQSRAMESVQSLKQSIIKPDYVKKTVALEGLRVYTYVMVCPFRES